MMNSWNLKTIPSFHILQIIIQNLICFPQQIHQEFIVYIKIKYPIKVSYFPFMLSILNFFNYFDMILLQIFSSNLNLFIKIYEIL